MQVLRKVTYQGCTLLFFLLVQLLMLTRCAQIGMPTGGDKDTIAPKLVRVNPGEFATNVKTNKITFTFSEYVEVLDAQNNLLINPFPKNMPVVEHKLKTVTVKLKDSLLPNTTYTFKFGNAIRDINEGNELKNFYYVFSTGNSIDSLTIGGAIINAETGQPDSLSLAYLYRNADDSSVIKRRPDFVAKPDGKGEFLFENLPAGKFKMYCLKDGDGSKTYNSKTEPFGFGDDEVLSGPGGKPVVLYSYTKEKAKPKAEPKAKPEKKLKYTTSLQAGKQDLLEDLKIMFNNPLKKIAPDAVMLMDTNYKKMTPVSVSIDTTGSILSVKRAWKEDEMYKLIIPKEAFTDTMGNMPAKTDTLTFTTARESEYGSITLRFSNIELNKNPVLQFIQGEEIKYSYPLSSPEWKQKLFHPGEYEIRVLYDDNKNRKWDPGDYSSRRQPEKAISIPGKISIRANWDNEKEVKL